MAQMIHHGTMGDPVLHGSNVTICHSVLHSSGSLKLARWLVRHLPICTASFCALFLFLRTVVCEPPNSAHRTSYDRLGVINDTNALDLSSQVSCSVQHLSQRSYNYLHSTKHSTAYLIFCSKCFDVSSCSGCSRIVLPAWGKCTAHAPGRTPIQII